MDPQKLFTGWQTEGNKHATTGRGGERMPSFPRLAANDA